MNAGTPDTSPIVDRLTGLTYVADIFIQLSGFRESRARWRRVLLGVGCAFGGVLTHFISTGIFTN